MTIDNTAVQVTLAFVAGTKHPCYLTFHRGEQFTMPFEIKVSDLEFGIFTAVSIPDRVAIQFVEEDVASIQLSQSDVL